MIWIKEGNACRIAGILHDHWLSRKFVPKESHATTSQLWLAYTGFNKESGKTRTEGPDVPQAVIYCCKSTTVLWMAELCQKHRRGNLRETVSETQHDPSTHEGLCNISIIVEPLMVSRRLPPIFLDNPWTRPPAIMITQPMAMGILRPKLSARTGLRGVSTEHPTHPFILRPTRVGWRPSCQFGREPLKALGLIRWGGQRTLAMSQSSGQR